MFFFLCNSSVEEDLPFFGMSFLFFRANVVLGVSDFLFLGSFLVDRLASTSKSSMVSSILSAMLESRQQIQVE